jgi:hypothetical protein
VNRVRASGHSFSPRHWLRPITKIWSFGICVMPLSMPFNQ